MKYNNSNLQILHARKIDSDVYLCSATNLLGGFKKKTLVVIVSHPRFTVKPPVSIFAALGDTLTLNCSATGDPQPVISWRKQGGHLPVDTGHYICTVTSAGVFKVETVTTIKFYPRGQF